mgnify:CR=1 FL=1
MTVDEHYKVLSTALNRNVYVSVCNHLNTCAKERKRIILRELINYITPFSETLNTCDDTLTYYNLGHIRTHLCKRHSFNQAKQYFLYILHLIKDLVNVGIFSSSLQLPEKISSTTEYEAYKESEIPEATLSKFSVPLSSQEIFNGILSNSSTLEIANGFREYVFKFKAKLRHRHREPITSFLNKIFNKDIDWQNNPSLINKVLIEYNIELNQRAIKSRPTSRSIYINLINSLAYLVKKGLLPKNTTLPEYCPRQPKNSHVVSKHRNDKVKKNLDNNLSKLSIFVSKSVYESINGYIISRNIKLRDQKELAYDLNTHIALLQQIFSNNVDKETAKNLEFILVNICQKYVFKSAKSRCNEVLYLIEYLVKKRIINGPVKIPTSLINEAEYRTLRMMKIPTEINVLISVKTAKDIFNDTLKNCCSDNIAKRITEHVNSFKERDRKSHRKPIVDFLNQISEVEKEWYKHPTFIQGELLKYRDNLLAHLDRGSAYNRFQNTKNAILVLIEHGLISGDTNLPNNIKPASNQGTNRKKNPLILQVDLYDKTKKSHYIDSPTFIDDITKELSQNLNQLVKVSQEIVSHGYSKFLEKDELIARSQKEEFILNPDFLIEKPSDTKQFKHQPKVNPFDYLHPLQKENLIAYYDLYFDQLINNEKPHNIRSLKFGKEITEYFGLTPLISSAMQIIIAEELGFNPHPLYNAKVSSGNRGIEYVNVNDEGNVRIKVIKPRARNVHKATAKGSLTQLAQLKSKDINAAACLKIAVEMGERSRTSLQSDHLWVSLMHGGVGGLPDTSTFQKHFNIIRDKAFESSGYAALKSATLKSVRCSKGVLIYLESNGDILKVTNYYGNQVKTALRSYIPQYLAELIYRVKMRSFQNILLYMTISSEEEPHKALDMNEKDFKDVLQKAFSNPDMGGNLFEKLSGGSPENNNDHPIYFCVSKDNIKIAVKYAKHGTDNELKKDCETVIRKLSEGPVIMKQMLRNSLKDDKGS